MNFTGLRFCLRRLICLVVLILGPLLEAAPKVTVRSVANLDTNNYTKVYLAPIKNDARKVYARLLKRLQKAGFDVVELNPDKLPFASQGTGFIISPEGHILTCAHVVGKEGEATLWIQGTRYLGRVLAVDTNLDTAVILVETNHAPFHAVSLSSNTNYHLGQEVFTQASASPQHRT